MTVTNEVRRKIMLMAWDSYRTALRWGEPRTFADALAGAWRFIKRLAVTKIPAWARGKGPRSVAFASLTRSPTERALRGQPYGGVKAYRAAYTTACVGY